MKLVSGTEQTIRTEILKGERMRSLKKAQQRPFMRIKWTERLGGEQKPMCWRFEQKIQITACNPSSRVCRNEL